jgi:hypothetical protein
MSDDEGRPVRRPTPTPNGNAKVDDRADASFPCMAAAETPRAREIAGTMTTGDVAAASAVLGRLADGPCRPRVARRLLARPPHNLDREDADNIIWTLAELGWLRPADLHDDRPLLVLTDVGREWLR